MARQYMTKEVTRTIIHSGKISINEEGLPIVQPNKDFEMLGTVSKEKAQKQVNKLYGLGSSIYKMEEQKGLYRMKVEDFIKTAELVTTDTQEDDKEDGTEYEEPTPHTMEENQNQSSNQEIGETVTTKEKEGRTRIKIIPKEMIES